MGIVRVCPDIWIYPDCPKKWPYRDNGRCPNCVLCSLRLFLLVVSHGFGVLRSFDVCTTERKSRFGDPILTQRAREGINHRYGRT